MRHEKHNQKCISETVIYHTLYIQANVRDDMVSSREIVTQTLKKSKNTICHDKRDKGEKNDIYTH